MNARLGLILVTAALFSGAGCAAGGGGSSTGPAAMPMPSGAGGLVLEEGISPRDNAQTRAANNFLDQAMEASDDVEKTALFQQALDAALQGIAADSGNPQSYFQAALANVNLGNYADAAEMFDKAETMHPRYILQTEAWRERGWVNAYNEALEPFNANDYAASAELFEAANSLYSLRPEAFLQLGAVYSQLGRPDDAVESFKSGRAILEESRERSMADTLLADPWVQQWEISSMGLGQALQLSEQWSEAADLYGQMLESEPDNTQIIGSLASVLTELNLPDSVDALYDNLLNRPGLTEFDFSNAGVGLFRIEEYDRAAQAFRSAADLNAFNRDARLNLTQTYYAAEDWENVIPAARELLTFDPLNGSVRIWMARSYSEMEQVEEANAAFEEYQAIGYETEGLMMTALASGGATVTGQLKNTTGAAGSTVTLRFHFGGDRGQEVGTIDIRVQLPAVDELVQFDGQFNSSDLVYGFKYEVVG